MNTSHTTHKTRLLLIRHGQSVANAEKRIQGWGDDPLSPLGVEQAERLAHWMQTNRLRADVLYASPLQRAYQTARFVSTALGLPIAVREGLREVSLGSLEDTSEPDFMQALAAGDITVTHGVETIHAFGERVVGTVADLLATHQGQTIVVCAHLGVVAVTLAHWLDNDVTLTWDKYGRIPNTSLSELHFSLAGAPAVELVHYGYAPHTDSVEYDW